MMVFRLLKTNPDNKLTCSNPGYLVDMFWLSELKVLEMQVSVFLVVSEGAPSCCSDSL